MAVDESKLNSFLGQAVSELGAVIHAGLVLIGEELGYYRALAREPLTSSQLAAATSTDERYAREWLAGQAAGGYIQYQPSAGTFWPTPETGLGLAV